VVLRRMHSNFLIFYIYHAVAGEALVIPVLDDYKYERIVYRK
jgi:hypothetical protein